VTSVEPRAWSLAGDADEPPIAGESWGPDRPADVVLVHAGVCDRRMWTGLAAELASAGIASSAYDLRGFGGSAIAADGIDHGHDLARVIDRTAVPQPVLIGASMGGATVLDHVVAGGRASGLVLIASTPTGYPRSQQTLDGWAREEELYEAGDLDAVIDVAVAMWAAGPHRDITDIDADIAGYVRAVARRELELHAAAPDVDQVDAPPVTAAGLSNVDVPTLLIHGDLDMPEVADATAWLAEHLPRATVTTVPGTAHLPSVERPDLVHPAVLQHVLACVSS
jgi:pimeloyl-ACP methyl ester carboxylesterase